MGRSIIIALLAVAVTLCSWSLVGCSNTELAQGLNAVAPGNGASAGAGRSAVRMVLKVTPDDGGTTRFSVRPSVPVVEASPKAVRAAGTAVSTDFDTGTSTGTGTGVTTTSTTTGTWTFVGTGTSTGTGAAVKVVLKGIDKKVVGMPRGIWRKEKTVPVGADGTAEIAFTELDKGPVSAQIQVSGGKIYNLDRFHGAEDLKDGMNSLVVVPHASGLKQDLVTQVVENIMKSTDTVQLMPDDLKGQVAGRFGTASTGSSDEKSAVTGLTNYFVKTYPPSTLVALAINDDSSRLLATPSSGSPWSKTPTDMWSGLTLWTYPLAEFRWREILKQGVDGFAYVAGDHTTFHDRFVVSKIDPVTGARKGTFQNRGECFPTLTLADESIVIGGMNKDIGCPVLFRWSGDVDAKARVVIGDTDDTNLKWAHYFSELTVAETTTYNGLLNVAYDDDKTLVCAVLNGSTRTYYKIDAETGAPIGQASTLSSNAPPTVTITAPANAATVNQGEMIPISVDVRDTDGVIQRVSYYANGEFLGSSNAGPWTYNWNNAYPGTYTIRAKAIDNGGAVTLSAGVAITVKATVVSSTRIKSLVSSPVGVTLALTDTGEVWAWGGPGYLCGQANEAIVTTPVRVNLPAAATSVAIDNFWNADGTCFAVLADGTVKWWGNALTGTGFADSPTTVVVRTGIPLVLRVGEHLTTIGGRLCSVTAIGAVIDPFGVDYTGPLPYTDTTPMWHTILSGFVMSTWDCVLTSDGVVRQLGGIDLDATNMNGISTLAVNLVGSRLMKKTDGTAWVFGSNESGQLGDATTVTYSRYLQRNSRLDAMTAFAMVNDAGFGLRSDGTVWGWGATSHLGGAVSSSAVYPTPIQIPLLQNVVRIFSDNAARVYAVRSDGSVFAWGANSSGRLGVGSADQATVIVPTRVPFP